MHQNNSLRLTKLASAAATLMLATSAWGADYGYTGEISLCTGTCDSFAALETGSSVAGALSIDVGASDSFTAADISAFGFAITSSEPIIPFDGTNPDVANPLPIAAGIAEIRDTVTVGGTTFTTGGNTDADGELTDGTILFEFIVPPFSSNSAWVIFDIATGTGQVCLFFANSGCIPGATEAVVVSGGFALVGGSPDSDGDGVTDDVDNCTIVANPTQLDVDGDGYGNACDGDFDNSCLVNIVDLGILRANFFAAGSLITDLNDDGITNIVDLGIFRTQFFDPPGPSPADPCTP